MREAMILPPEGTCERWAFDYVAATTLDEKLEPKPAPLEFEAIPVPRRLTRPGRPPELVPITRAKKTRGLGTPRGRARTLHTFFHHELQAAELMAWAVLAFPEAPRKFREGLLGILRDEVRHMNLYKSAIEALGFRIGDFPVRDWFWERIPTAETAASFVAVMGLGLEGANLERARDYAELFRKAGDERSADVQETVLREEIAHVRFGVRWFRELTGDLEFDGWCAALPPPLSPLLMRGDPIDRETRELAGFPPPFLDRLAAWTPESPGS